MHRRKMALGLVVIGAALAAFGALYRDWWSGEVFYGSSLNIGLRSFEVCGGGTCESQPLDALVGDEHGAWVAVGSLLFFAALAAAASLLLTGGLEVARKRVRRPIAPTTIGFLLSSATLLLGFLFLMLKPAGLHGTGLQAGIAFFILAAGGIAGLMGALLLAKEHALEDNVDWLAEVSQQAEPPAPWLDG